MDLYCFLVALYGEFNVNNILNKEYANAYCFFTLQILDRIHSVTTKESFVKSSLNKSMNMHK